MRLQGATKLALTKLDVLDGFDEIKICTAYEIDGELVGDFPFGERLVKAKPHIVWFDGWKAPTTACRKFSDLPVKAQEYVRYIEKVTECPIGYVSVGAERDSIIVM